MLSPMRHGRAWPNGLACLIGDRISWGLIRLMAWMAESVSQNQKVGAGGTAGIGTAADVALLRPSVSSRLTAAVQWLLAGWLCPARLAVQISGVPTAGTQVEQPYARPSTDKHSAWPAVGSALSTCGINRLSVRDQREHTIKRGTHHAVDAR